MSAKKAVQSKSTTTRGSISGTRRTSASKSSKQPKVTAPVPVGKGRPDLRPPLERAIHEFSGELRQELDRTSEALEAVRAELAQLREEIAELRGRYDSHTHPYKGGTPGSGGYLWFNLGQIRHYVDEEETDWSEYGTYLRGGPSTGETPNIQTGPPA